MALHLLRTRHLPFVQSRPARPVLLVTLLGVAAFTALTMTPIGTMLGMTGLPPIYFLFLFITVTGYLLGITLAKRLYIRTYQTLL